MRIRARADDGPALARPGNAIERTCRRLDIGVERVVRVRIGNIALPELREIEVDAIDLARIAQIGGRPEHEAVDDAKECRVRAEAERDRENDRGGEPRAPAQSARGPAQVLPQCVEQREPARIAGRLLHLLDASEREPSLASRFVFRQSIGDQPVGLDVDVKLNFVRKLALDVTATEERAETETEIAQQVAQHLACSARLQDEPDRGHQLRPRVRLGLELLASAPRELVVLCAPIVLRHAPLGLDPAAAFEPVQRRVQRAGLDVELVARDLADPRGYSPSMQRRERQRLENEEIEGALWQFESRVGHAFPCGFYGKTYAGPVEVQGKANAGLAGESPGTAKSSNPGLDDFDIRK